ncbi:hypothetical protein [Hydrogenimonas thermophila]|uniref:Uncharacterized protein n=1 Tax=Hydrogenimonas thermophila TaxID=223786 RepID=A0A1I5TQP3_9BACT|nr:hypothetical protein [Hydrogenimonas thermophila]SFP85392.1 hypothetical protein SAMN05216234_1473 [Hydrogenimonas thermophila]
MELFATVISGVLIFVLGQLLLKLVVEPLQELKKEIALTLDSLFFYKYKISSPNANLEKDIFEVSSILRKHSSNLEVKSSIIPFYNCWYKLRILPSKKNIKKATNKLIGISNSLSPNNNNNNGIENSFQVKEVKTLLRTSSKSSIIKSLIITIIILLSIYFLNSAINNAVKFYCDKNITTVRDSKK